jgi:hypothetical protein
VESKKDGSAAVAATAVAIVGGVLLFVPVAWIVLMYHHSVLFLFSFSTSIPFFFFFFFFFFFPSPEFHNPQPPHPPSSPTHSLFP